VANPSSGHRSQAAAGLTGEGWLAKQGFAGDIDDATKDEVGVQAVLQMASLTAAVAL
jgi:hypothetical protein